MWLVLLPKLERRLQFVFHVLAGSIGKTICGGKIGSSGLQACVAPVPFGSTSCSVRSHATKETSLSDDTLYIRTPFVAGKLAIYLTSLLPVSSLSPKVLPYLLQATRSVEVWSSLLPRFSSLSPSEIKELIISVDQAVTFKTDFTTPFKSNSSTLGSPKSFTSFTEFI